LESATAQCTLAHVRERNQRFYTWRVKKVGGRIENGFYLAEICGGENYGGLKEHWKRKSACCFLSPRWDNGREMVGFYIIFGYDIMNKERR
jgi:hypothetical protein